MNRKLILDDLGLCGISGSPKLCTNCDVSCRYRKLVEKERTLNCYNAIEDCKNIDESYSETCVKCNRCERFGVTMK